MILLLFLLIFTVCAIYSVVKQQISLSIEKVRQLSNISTKLVLALGATYQVGKPQLIK